MTQKNDKANIVVSDKLLKNYIQVNGNGRTAPHEIKYWFQVEV